MDPRRPRARSRCSSPTASERAGAQVSTLVLASASPQRRAILESLGIVFEVRPSHFSELVEGEPAALAAANALGKASDPGPGAGELVLGVDTLVALGGRIYGKPADAEHARATLAALSGRTHEVFSGLALLEPGAEPRCATVRTLVRFRALEPALIDWYLASGEWRERAGAYAIQGAGAALVAAVDGEVSNVVGLPVGALLALRPGLLDPRNNRFSARLPGK